MTIMLKDLVDFDKIDGRLGDVGTPKARELIREVVISRARGLSLNDALRGVDYGEYIGGVSNAEMVKDLYERLVPVHDIERGVVAPVYFANKPFMGSAEFCEGVAGIRSSDMATYLSCAGHLPGEPQTGRDTGGVKFPFMYFFPRWDIEDGKRGELDRLLGVFRNGGHEVTDAGVWGINVSGRVSSKVEHEVIAQIREFWRGFLKNLNEYHGKAIFKEELVEVIRPSARVPKV